MILLDWSKKPKSGTAKVPPIRKIAVEAMNITIKERDASATLTTWDLDGISINSWLIDDTEPGKDICWRVKSIEQVPGTNTNRITLEHAINLLRDRIIWGEYKPADIIKAVTGKDSSADTCLASEALVFIMAGQEDWLLDMRPANFEYKEVYGAYSFDGDTLYDALETVCGTLEDCEWLMDMSKYPFTLRIRRKLDGVASEVRAGRNLRTLTKTIDRGGMYTRLFPVGNDDLQLSTNREKACVEDRISSYGIIEKSETNSSLDSKTTLTNWAKNKLHYKSQPTVTITVDALELSDATGEDMDHFILNRICRVPLPEYGGQIIKERITQIQFPDKIGKPTECKLTLSNAATELTTIIASLAKESSSTSRSSSRTSKTVTDTANTLLYAVKDVRIKGPTKNIYTLQYLLVLDKEGDNWRDAGNFSRAVDEWSVSVAGGAIRVKALPQDQDHVVYVQAGPASRSGNIYTGPIQWRHMVGKEYTKWGNTGATYTVDATERYNQGFRDTTLTGSWSGNKYTATAKNSNITGSNTKTVETTTFTEFVGWSDITDGKKGTIRFYYLDGSTHKEILSAVVNMKLTGSWSGNTYTATMKHGSTNVYSVSTQTFTSTPTWENLSDGKKGTISFYYFNGSTATTILSAVLNMHLTGSWSGNTYTATMKQGNNNDSAYSISTQTFTSTPTWENNGDGDGKKGTINFYYFSGSTQVTILSAVLNMHLTGSWSGNTYTATMIQGNNSSSAFSIATNTFTEFLGWEDITDGKKGTISFYYIDNGTHVEILSAVMNMKLTGSWSGNTYTATMKRGSSSVYSIATNTFTEFVGWEDITDGKKGTIRFYYLNGNTHVEILSAVMNMKLTGSWSGNTYTATMKRGSSETVYSIATNTFVEGVGWGTGSDVNKYTVSFYYISGGSHVEILPAVVDASTRYEAGKADAPRSVSDASVGTFSSSVSPSSALAGWSPQQVTGVGNSQQGYYRYIKFKVDGKQRSFYFA